MVPALGLGWLLILEVNGLDCGGYHAVQVGPLHLFLMSAVPSVGAREL